MCRGIKITILLLTVRIFYCTPANAQLPVTMPWSSSLNITFGKDSPVLLPPGSSDFTYTSDVSPINGQYTVIKNDYDAGHIFSGPFVEKEDMGYKMLARYNANPAPGVLFRDTVRNLCGNSKYLFWVAINKLPSGDCLLPNLTLSVETTSGIVISSFSTGDIGGPLAQDNYAWYPGYYDRTKKPPFAFYGGVFQLPAGINDIVVKIIVNPSNAFYQCSTLIEVDNIIVMPIGPDIRISSAKHPGGWITGSCFKGDVPLELQGKIEEGYLSFGTTDYVLQSYADPAFQWQQSLDGGYTWTDIPGETNISISHIFNIPDTFWVRMRVSESTDIGNKNCSNVSNIMKVQVEEPDKNFSLKSNSPVCTDGDLQLTVSGGATYNTYGPNGFFDDSPFPHIYHPDLADSGWYYAEASTFGGCKTVDSEYVKIIGPAITTITPDRNICYGDTVHLYASGGLEYVWSPSYGLNNAAIANPVAAPLTTTNYEVKVTDNNGCHAYEHVTVTLRDSLLKAIFTAPDVACPGDVVTFRDTSLGKIVNWNWNFGNGKTSNLQNPPAQYYPVINNTSFPVSLTITDTAGCVQTTTKNIRSVNNCYIAVPSAFTPNNDGLNDFLYPLNAYKATHLVFKVYNRDGNLVYMTNDWTKKWDGTLKGIPQPTGIYVWMLNYTDENQKPVFLKGTAALIR